MAISNVRVSGSGYTVITFNGKKVELLRTFQDSGQQPVATAEAIQGINDEYPTEIAFPKALGPGTLTFTTYELWEKGAWQEIFNGRFSGSNDLLDVFKRQLALGSIQIQKVISGQNGKGRVETYQNVVVTSISNAENINLQTMTQPKTVTCMYTRVTTTN